MIKNQVILRVHLDVEKRGRESYVEKNGHNESLTVLSTTLPLFLYIGPLSHVYLMLRKRKHSFFLFWGLVGVCVWFGGFLAFEENQNLYKGIAFQRGSHTKWGRRYGISLDLHGAEAATHGIVAMFCIWPLQETSFLHNGPFKKNFPTPPLIGTCAHTV